MQIIRNCPLWRVERRRTAIFNGRRPNACRDAPQRALRVGRIAIAGVGMRDSNENHDLDGGLSQAASLAWLRLWNRRKCIEAVLPNRMQRAKERRRLRRCRRHTGYGLRSIGSKFHARLPQHD